ncbi:MAG: SycD/LcrH family type III secretion system chaperone [Chlamydiia bacterium]|nr:SycD/LcrH family type III secretion system chaperone [Chlamydiia bacterium]
MKDIDEQIEKMTESIKDKASPKEIKMQKEALEKILKEGMSVHEAVGVSKESLEFMYSHGYSLYKVGKYDDAIQIFHILNFLDGNDLRFCYGLAACHHMKKEYNEAMVLYLICQTQDRHNPGLMWHIADCYKGMGKKMNAYLCLKLCSRYADEDKKYESLKIRADGEAKMLEKELDEEFQKTVKK